MEIIDSHCHLDFPVLQSQLADVLLRAKSAGVNCFVVPGVNHANWARVLELSRQHINIYAALGVHPCFLDTDSESSLVELTDYFAKNADDIVAVGEIGLDLYESDKDSVRQLSILNRQLQLAADFNKPVILHVRKAHDLMLKQLRRIKLERGGVVHAFSGSLQQAEEYIKLGFKLGVGGSITYERAKKLRRTFAQLPLASLVLETDSPDMPLCGYQGEINYPERAALVAASLADLRNISLAEVAEITSENSQAIFNI
ncbi:TatD family hydrolase [Aliamphritea ceti]|uniref:TatD family hydrolase n=1 Tax=Aliamphritea ceti TaxID=1524258 RepID=UPI0021C3E156|nr:TatD family hydrolase [Aliamphritea ceti]